MDTSQVVETRSLEHPLHLADLVAYHRYAGIPWWRQIWTIGALVLIGVGLASYLGFVLLPAIAPTVPGIISLIIGGSGVLYLLLFLAWAVYYLRAAKIGRFAAENNFYFSQVEKGNRREGSAFRLHATSIERELIQGSYNGHLFAMGRRYTVGNKNDSTTIHMPFSFIELELPRKVPHIILKNKRSRVISLAGIGLGKTKKISLDGTFSKTFLLYCPEGYEREAFYIFTPDVMAILLDSAANTEIELIDTHLYIYRKHGTRLDRPDAAMKSFQLIDILLEKFEKQTKNYKDSTAFKAKQSSNAAITLRGRRMHISDISGLHIVWVAGVILLSAVFMLVPYLIAMHK